MPEVKGRRLGDGEELDDEFHLDIGHSYDRPSYEYGKSKRSLRPEVPANEDEVARIIETTQRQVRRQARSKRLRKPPLPAKFNSTRARLHYRPEREPERPYYLIEDEPVVVCARRSTPHPTPLYKRPGWVDARTTGADIEALLAEND